MFHVRVSECQAALSTVQAMNPPSALARSYAAVQRRLIEKDH